MTTPDFFVITKRIHQAIHGSSGDGSPLGEEQHAVYRRVLSENADELRRLISPDDIVILHDPQTAGLAPELIQHGCRLIQLDRDFSFLYRQARMSFLPELEGQGDQGTRGLGEKPGGSLSPCRLVLIPRSPAARG